MQLIILEDADADTDRLYEFILERNPIAAQKAVLALDESMRKLLENPYSGTPSKTLSGVRELYIPFGKQPYVVQYRIDEPKQAVVVLRIWHGREARS